MICSSRLCNKVITYNIYEQFYGCPPWARIFCDENCKIQELREAHHEPAQQNYITSIKGTGPEPYAAMTIAEYKPEECKYCISSSHTGFCCEGHKKLYHTIMWPIQKELSA